MLDNFSSGNSIVSSVSYLIKKWHFVSPADIQFWISDDVTKNGLWARQTRINIHSVFAALTF